MDTQKNISGDDPGKKSSSSASDVPLSPKQPQAGRPLGEFGSTENDKGSVPDNLPFTDDSATEVQKPIPEEKKEDNLVVSKLATTLKPAPKIVPGMRGPLPMSPANPLKQSAAKFGNGTPPHGSEPKNPIKKEDSVHSITSPSSVSGLGGNFSKLDKENISNKILNEKEKNTEQVFSRQTPARPKIGVPVAPIAPVKMKENLPVEEGNNKASITSSTGASKNIPLPVAPPSGANVDRNIRPRRLLLVIIVLLAFIGLIFLSLWYFLTKGDSPSPAPSPTESSLFSPGASPIVVATPSPTADISLTQDSDSDGISDAQEIQLGTNPFQSDTDGDGYLDKQEIDAGYDPLVNGGKLDTDRDGLPDPDERCWGTDSRNPDTDGDGYLDGQEVINGYDPLVPSPKDKLSGPARCNN